MGLRIAMLAPPWIPIPAPGYGGIEEVVRLLCDGLVARGNDVTLFAAPGTKSGAEVRSPLAAAHPDQIERSLWEMDHVARTFDAIDRYRDEGRPFDVVHDHTGFAALAMANRLDTPVVHTMHGPLDGDTRDFYARHGHKAQLVALSESQARDVPEEVRDAVEVVHNPISAAEWPFSAEPGGELLWIGRMADVKGPHRAIEAARAAGARLALAGPVQPGQEEFFGSEVEPHFSGDGVRYVGEVAGDGKKRLYGASRALLMPIRWPEPFGLVMIEAMVCGTPVIAFPEGAASEVVEEGETGFLVDDVEGMAQAIARVGEIDRERCRASAIERFDAANVVPRYEAIYAQVA